MTKFQRRFLAVFTGMMLVGSLAMAWAGFPGLGAVFQVACTPTGGTEWTPPTVGKCATGPVIFVKPVYSGTPTGDPGTFTNPYDTIQEAATAATAGTTIYLMEGVYPPEFNIRFAFSGTENCPIAVEGYADEEVILTGGESKWIFDFTDDESEDMEGFGWYEFRNFMIQDSRHGWRFEWLGDGSKERPHHITIENVDATNCASVIAARGAGVEFLTVRGCDFSGSQGTEGNIDIGVNAQDLNTDNSGSHDILIEDCNFHDSNPNRTGNQQINGIVFQGDTYNVTLRRCKAWNNGKYGFALKGSGNYLVDSCAAWGNGSSQFYLRGAAVGDPGGRTSEFLNDITLTNCIAIPAPNSGGAAYVWRECTNLTMYHCTAVSFHDETRLRGAGSAFALSNEMPLSTLGKTANLVNCVFVVWDGVPFTMGQGNSLPYVQYVGYDGDTNLFWKIGRDTTTLFKYQNTLHRSIGTWKTYWATGTPVGGNDGVNGPLATSADANSVFDRPSFRLFPTELARVPVKWEWPATFEQIVDVIPQDTSILVGMGTDLEGLGLDELKHDYYQRDRVDTDVVGACIKVGSVRKQDGG